MIEIGKYNTLPIKRFVDFGAYLETGPRQEILLPLRYLTPEMQVGDQVEVFVYNDSEDRLIATTERPLATVGQFAFLTVKSVNRIGAFLDWGLLKDLLVPFSQQKSRMKEGGRYLVYLYLDDATKRIVASAKVERFLGNVLPQYKAGAEVDILITEKTPIGYACIVDDLHRGMVYDSATFRDLSVGDRLKAYVQKVRRDGKIDITLSAAARQRTADLADIILQDAALQPGGFLPVDDHADADEIRRKYQCSKRDYKQAVGHLLKAEKIVRNGDGKLLLRH